MLEFHFSNTQSAYLLIFVLLMIVFLRLIWKHKKSTLQKMGSNRVLPKIGQFPSKKLFWVKGLLLAASSIFFIAALAEPQGNPHYVPLLSDKQKKDVRKKEHEVAIFLDISSSMATQDMRLGKTRLEYAKEIIDALIKNLKGETVSLHLFTSEVEKRVPPTIDYLYTRFALNNVEINDIGAEGTNISKTISTIISEATQEKKGKKTTYIILTDGEGTEGTLPEEALLKEERGRFGFAIIGLGTEKGGVVPNVKYQGKEVISTRDDKTMKEVSEGLSGEYYIAETSSPLLLAEKVLREVIKEPSYSEETIQKETEGINELRYDPYFRYPLALGLLLYILAITMPLYTPLKR